MFKIVNIYEDIDGNIFFKLKEGSRTRGHKAMRNEWNKLPNDCVDASNVNMFKNRFDRYLIRAGYT